MIGCRAEHAVLAAAFVLAACSSDSSSSHVPDGGSMVTPDGGTASGGSASGGAPNGTAGTGKGGTSAQAGAAGSSGSVAVNGGAGAGNAGGGANDGGMEPDASPGPTIPKPPSPGSFLAHPKQGTTTLETAADITAFCSQYDGVIGSLTVSSPTITTLDALKCLLEVTGTLTIDAALLTSASLPNLRAVGALDLGDARGLATVDLSKLEFVSVGDLRIYGSDALFALTLPALAFVAKNFAITANTKLTDIGAPNLVYAGGEVASDNSMLVHADFTNLAQVGDVFRIASTAVPRLELREIRTAGKDLGILSTSYANVDLSHLQSVGGSLSVGGNDKPDDLTVLDLSSLTAVGFMSIERHPQLKEIRAPKLTSTSSIFVTFDPELESIALPRLVTSEINFNTDPKLTTVDLSALVTANSIDLRTGGPLTVVLPSLTTVTGIQTSGIRSFSAPLVTMFTSATFAGAPDGFRLDLPRLTQGNLRLGTGLDDLSVPALERCDTLTVLDVALSELEFPHLDHATTIAVAGSATLASLNIPLIAQLDELDLGGDKLKTVAFDALAKVSKLNFEQAPALQSISFASLTEVDTLLSVDATGLSTFSLPKVTFAGSLDVRTNPNLTSVALPAADVLSLYVTDNLVLASLDLRSMKKPLDFSMSNNGKLTALSGFSSLTGVGRDFYVLNHPVLVDLQGLHGIRSVGGKFHITGNTMLPHSEIDSLVAAIGKQNITGEFVVQ